MTESLAAAKEASTDAAVTSICQNLRAFQTLEEEHIMALKALRGGHLANVALAPLGNLIGPSNHLPSFTSPLQTMSMGYVPDGLEGIIKEFRSSSIWRQTPGFVLSKS